MEERVKRKHAAIVPADGVGWSRLMGEDEAGTLAILKRPREEPIDPKIDYQQYRPTPDIARGSHRHPLPLNLG